VGTEPGSAVVLITGVMAGGKSTVAERPKTGYGIWTVGALDQALRMETPRIGLWLDISEQTPHQTVSAILDNLPAACIETGWPSSAPTR
jgi:hypothetical protein